MDHLKKSQQQSPLHKKRSFSLRTFPANVTKSAVFTKEILDAKLYFLCKFLPYAQRNPFLSFLNNQETFLNI